jgi:hypothetical protein
MMAEMAMMVGMGGVCLRLAGPLVRPVLGEHVVRRRGAVDERAVVVAGRDAGEVAAAVGPLDVGVLAAAPLLVGGPEVALVLGGVGHGDGLMSGCNVGVAVGVGVELLRGCLGRCGYARVGGLLGEAA